MKKILIVFILIILILSGLETFAISIDITSSNEKFKEELIELSDPIIKDTGQYVVVDIKDSSSSLQEPGKPLIPVVSKVYIFPFGTKIDSIDLRFSGLKEQTLNKEIQLASEPINVDLNIKSESARNTEINKNQELYPSVSYSYDIASGLNENEHVIYLIVQLYPIRYSTMQNKIYYNKNVKIKIKYNEPINPIIFNDEYDMVIIAPSEYFDELQPLINHKNSHGIKTLFKSTEDIYYEFEGYDKPEEIKYFIKYALEEFGIDYVLLVGSIDKLPIRSSSANVWEGDLLTDLYYSDVYNNTGGFCTWDENKNGKFGEVNYQHHQTYDIDGVDLFPDVNIGRLACSDSNEVNIVIDKIIYYETNTYDKNWFNNIIFCGGDTFPDRNGNEGEQINNIIEQIMSDFVPTKLWTSTNTFSASKLNNAINNGAGFVDYSGHGIENGIGTHPPKSNSWKMYYNINLLGLSNGYKLPIIFFDACLTSKLDYDGSKTNFYTPRPVPRIRDTSLIYSFFKTISRFLMLFQNKLTTKSVFTENLQSFNTLPLREESNLVSCFSWNFVKKSNGGAIATIGATRTAFGGTNSGAGKISIEFFSAYKNSVFLSQMMTQAQINYIIDVPEDLLTIEEFILLGDPSLKIGGYPS